MLKFPGQYAFVLATVGLASATSVFAHSDEILCGTVYTVEEADTLSNISQWAYGTPVEYARIHQANAELLGSDVGNLSVGMQLSIPCIEGQMPNMVKDEGADDALTQKASVEELLAASEKAIAEAREALAATGDGDFPTEPEAIADDVSKVAAPLATDGSDGLE